MESCEQLATYRRCVERIRSGWPAFQVRRDERLRERERFGHAAERATESILEDLFTLVLDWSAGDVNHQVGRADLILTRLGLKYLIVEAKAPGALAWNRRAVEVALDQACRYAAEQKVRTIAVSDGTMLYAADVSHGGLRDRVFCRIDPSEPQDSLWWLSIDGIHRERADTGAAALQLLPESSAQEPAFAEAQPNVCLHPKYKLPARCFGYVGDAGNPRSWHLPYRNLDGSVDAKRLPKAIQCIVSTFRGERVHSIPEAAIPDVLVRLARAAGEIGKLPRQTPKAAPAYVHLVAALEQLNRLDEIQ